MIESYLRFFGLGFAIVCLSLALDPSLAVAQEFGTCEQSLGEAYLDANNVRARILNTGSLFYRREPHVYEVPRFSGSNAIFAGSIWIAGLIDGELRVSASRYGEWELWAGPLDDNGNPPADCDVYDHVYKVRRTDIEEYEATGQTTDDLRYWPTGLGAPTLDAGGSLIDLAGQPLSTRLGRTISLAAGERPLMPGNQAIWWVMNDRGNEHKSTDSLPMGLEVHGHAFAFLSSEDAINDATHYRYRIFNKNSLPITDAYVGIFLDVDLGDGTDDVVGSDSVRSLGFVYNADNEDEGREGYGTPPPALGIMFLEGPLAERDFEDNNGDGQVDEDGERLQATTIGYFNSGGGVNEDPRTAADYYNYLQGKWKNGRPYTIGGNGFDYSSEVPTHFVFPGDPVTSEFWSEMNMDGLGTRSPVGDRRLFISAGPFFLDSGEETDFTVAIVWALGVDHLDSVNEMKTAADVVRAAFDEGFANIPPATSLEPQEPIVTLSPDNGVSNQPISTLLYWSAQDDAKVYRIELSSVSGTVEFESRETSFRIPDLSAGQTYFWRVRGENVYGLGPWSGLNQFTTGATDFGHGIESFTVVQNGAGLLDPPDMGTYAINSSGFPATPCPNDPQNKCLAPTPGYQQATNNAIWGFNTGGSNRYTFETFLDRTFRSNPVGRLGFDDYEMRFTQRCVDDPSSCIAWRRFEDDLPVQVPFEIWNVGPSDDPSDDVRLIPAILEIAGPSPDVFDIGDDHAISDGDDDPYSDWVYWHKPMDMTPGESGYQAFAAAPGNESEALGEEIMARIVLVQLDGGSAPPYVAALPETGSVFRISTIKPTAPILASPRSQSVFETESVAFYWNGIGSMNLQVYNVDENREVFFGTDVQTGHVVEIGKDGHYYWRVQTSSGLWSTPWVFQIAGGFTGTDVTTDNELPRKFELFDNYPNPFNPTTTIRYTLPRASEVRLEVFNVIGARVRVLENRTRPAGKYEITFDATRLGSGIYFYTLKAGDFMAMKKMVLLR